MSDSSRSTAYGTFLLSFLIAFVIWMIARGMKREASVAELDSRRSELVGRCHGEKRQPIITADGDVLCMEPAGIAWRKAP